MSNMNENINLCKILKNCPKGTKFYSPLYGEVTFIKINTKTNFLIEVLDEGKNRKTFMSDGRYDGFNKECLLFPSKDQKDWNKFKAPWLKKSKFDPKTLRPFEKVLIFNYAYERWICDFYSYIIEEYDENSEYQYKCIGDTSDKIIPYNDDTKHLVGTSDEAPEFYRYWED